MDPSTRSLSSHRRSTCRAQPIRPAGFVVRPTAHIRKARGGSDLGFLIVVAAGTPSRAVTHARGKNLRMGPSGPKLRTCRGRACRAGRRRECAPLYDFLGGRGRLESYRCHTGIVALSSNWIRRLSSVNDTGLGDTSVFCTATVKTYWPWPHKRPWCGDSKRPPALTTRASSVRRPRRLTGLDDTSLFDAETANARRR